MSSVTAPRKSLYPPHNSIETDPNRARLFREVSEHGSRYLGLFLRVLSPKSRSRREAIKSFCLECVWMDKDAVRHCTATACPLWNFRPFRACRKENAR